jgi:hypothetical protein
MWVATCSVVRARCFHSQPLVRPVIVPSSSLLPFPRTFSSSCWPRGPRKRKQQIAAARRKEGGNQPKSEQESEGLEGEDGSETEADIRLSPEQYQEIFDEDEEEEQDADPKQQEFFDRLAGSDDEPDKYYAEEPIIDSDGEEVEFSDEESGYAAQMRSSKADAAQTFTLDDLIEARTLDADEDPEGPFLTHQLSLAVCTVHIRCTWLS